MLATAFGVFSIIVIFIMLFFVFISIRLPEEINEWMDDNLHNFFMAYMVLYSIIVALIIEYVR